ncbi:MAG TPA: hypothetical protein P5511_00450, partial [Candidatus Goldiibacteriota bacterium]|nr:hypothetical protein [Candidatus Goldiibacteriota bacterium]
ETVLTTKVIPVEETEVPQWQAMIKGGKSSDERSKGAFWTGQYYFNKKDYPAASKYFEYNLKYYIDTDWGYLSAVRMADIYLEQKDNDRALDTIKVLYEKRLQFAAFKQAASSRLLELLKSVD